MDEEAAEKLSGAKLRQLQRITRSAGMRIGRSDLIKLFTRAGAKKEGDEHNVQLVFNGQCIGFQINQGRASTGDLTVGRDIADMARELLAHHRL